MTKMTPLHTVSLFALLSLAACSSPQEALSPPSGGATVATVGTYDPRAVCIAYVNGPLFQQWASAQAAAHEAAKQKGDTATCEAIEQTMQSTQARFHEQAFSGGDVEDILAVVADAVAKVCSDAGVARVEKVNQARAAGVATVDVTAKLVALFQPNEKGRGWIADLKDRPLR
jgi:hypothetical protein